MTIPELFAAHYERTNGNILECFRVVLEAEAMERRRPVARLQGVDSDWVEARARDIATAIASHAGLTFRDLAGPSRLMRITTARHDSWLMIREMTAMTNSAIGVLMGNRDHSTVINGCWNALDRITVDPKYGEMLRAVALVAMGGTNEGKAAA